MAARRARPALDAQGLAGKPVFVFETGGTTGMPKTRVAHRTTSGSTTSSSATTLPDEYFPRGSNWLMLGPSGPRRLRLSVEHLAQYRGGICFCVDLDPRWVIKLIKKGWSEHLQAYKDHVIDQAVTILQAGHDIRCMFTTPKLLEALALRLESMGTTIRKAGHHRHLLRRHRVHAAVEPLRARRTARRRLHDADLRQHADGPGGQRAERAAQRLQDHLLRAAAAGGDRGGRFRRSRRKLVEYGADRTREADDADEGVLHAGIPRARRRRARAAVRQHIPGTASAASGRTAGFASTTTVGVY